MMKERAHIDELAQSLYNEVTREKPEETTTSSEVREAAVALERQVTFRNLLKDKMLVVKSIRHGVPYVLFEEIQKQTPFSEEDWADFLNVSTKSLQRYKAAGKHTFKPIHSEKIFELAEVTELGKEVFGDPEKFYRWLDAPAMAFGWHKPIDLIRSSYGKELVIDALHRIDHGIFA